jgi:flavin-dependent dehydrogenase
VRAIVPDALTALAAASRPWDVVVVGGGVAGTAAAIMLGRDARVLVLEAGDYSGWRIGESLPPDARPLLSDLGVLPRFLSCDHLPCHGSSAAWGSDRPGFNDFLYNPNGHGWHLDRVRFERFLAREATQAGATVLTGTRLVAARSSESGLEIDVRAQDGEPLTLDTVLAVDATGVGAALARALGAERIGDGALLCRSALLASDAISDTADSLTRIEATPDGWWYLAQLPGARRIAAFFTDPDLAPDIRTEPGWRARLDRTKHLARRVGDAAASPVRSHAVPLGHLAPSGGARWLAAGDAAFSCDPILSQGLYAALLSGTRAAKRISAALAEGRCLTVAPDEAARDYAAARTRTRALYAVEQRWPEAPFWQRRQASATVDNAVPTVGERVIRASMNIMKSDEITDI